MVTFEVTLTLDELVIRWPESGRTADLVAEEMGVAAAKLLGYEPTSASFGGTQGNEQRWKRPKLTRPVEKIAPPKV